MDRESPKSMGNRKDKKNETKKDNKEHNKDKIRTNSRDRGHNGCSQGAGINHGNCVAVAVNTAETLDTFLSR